MVDHANDTTLCLDVGLHINYKCGIRGGFMFAWLMNLFSKNSGNTAGTNTDKERDDNNSSGEDKEVNMGQSNLKITIPNPTTISIDGGEGSFDFQGDYDKLRELVNQANEFWIINLSATSNSFFQCHIGENIYEYWKDGEMLTSSKGGTDEALTFLWKLTY